MSPGGIVLLAILVVLLVSGLAVGLTLGLAKKPQQRRSYHASAARGDFFVLDLSGDGQQLTYTNHTNAVTGTATVTRQANGFLTFGDNKDLKTALEIPNSVLVFHTATAGPSKAEKGFALGLNPKPYTAPAFPAKQLIYMQFRTSNSGYEIGFIDARTNELSHQNWSPSACWYDDQTHQPTDGAVSRGVGKLSAFPVDAATFTLAADALSLSKVETEQGRSSTITIFQTATDDVVLDMDNGSIFAVPEATSDSLPEVGTYAGLLYGKDAAEGQNDNTESGTPLTPQLTLVVQADGKFTWSESGVTLEGTLVPLHTQVTMSGGRSLHGAFHARVVTGGKTTDVAVLKGSAALLVAYYVHTEGQSAYAYRHGACIKV